MSARVQSVEAIFGSPVIHFRGNNEFLTVSAFLSSMDKERAATLKRGEVVAVLCQTAKKVIGAALYDCSLTNDTSPATKSSTGALEAKKRSK